MQKLDEIYGYNDFYTQIEASQWVTRWSVISGRINLTNNIKLYFITCLKHIYYFTHHKFTLLSVNGKRCIDFTGAYNLDVFHAVQTKIFVL